MNEETRKIRVLLVDDDEGVRSSLSRLFRRHNLDVATAVNGERALKRIKRGERFDCLLVDLLMPVMSGKRLIEHLAETGLYPLNRVIILTAVHHADNATAYMQYGCAGYCGKPWENRRILDQIARACATGENTDPATVKRDLDALI